MIKLAAYPPGSATGTGSGCESSLPDALTGDRSGAMDNDDGDNPVEGNTYRERFLNP